MKNLRVEIMKYKNVRKIASAIGIIGIIILTVISWNGCNKQIHDFVYDYDEAYIYNPDGTVDILKISKWRDYEDGKQLLIIDTDGNVWLLSSMNTRLVNWK